MKINILLVALFAAGAAGRAAAFPEIIVPDGFAVEVAAAAPLVGYPMMGCFDERGRLFLAESAGHNLDEKQLDATRPNFIRMLTDTDGDGVFDTSTIFAGKLAIPNGAHWLDGSLYVAEPPGIWRFTDTDDDGVADRREHIAGNVRSNGMSSTLHGPALHPSGWLFWCGGQQGYHLDKNEEPPEGRIAPGVFCLKPDGTEHQIFAVGGMANPVEVTFNDHGDVFGTLAILDQPDGVRHDALLHWVYGGRFRPRADAPIPLKRTGPPLPPMSHVGQVAPAGLTCYRSTQFGKEFCGDIFWSQFNTRTVARTRIEPAGATYRSTDESFLTSPNVDFHPTDVIEDADGSLLVIDTGGWFRHGCPTSHIAKREALGGIYRVRRKGAPPLDDPRGLAIAWDDLDADALVKLFDDPRPAVEDRAIASAARLGEDALEALLWATSPERFPQMRRDAVWTLSRIGMPAALEIVADALEDEDATVRKAAAFVLGMARYGKAGNALARVAAHDEDHLVRREAAAAAGRIGDGKAVTRLLSGLADSGDPFLQHSFIYALIQINRPDEIIRSLPDFPQPRARRGALLALSQMDGVEIDRAFLASFLRSGDSELQRAAFDVALDSPLLKREAEVALREFLSHPDAAPSPAQLDVYREALETLAAGASGQELIAVLLVKEETGARVRHLLIDVMKRTPFKTVPASWLPALRGELERRAIETRLAVIEMIRERSLKDFDDAVLQIARDEDSGTALRIASLNAIAPRLKPVDPELFVFVRENVFSEGDPAERLGAARTLASLPLSGEQLIELARSLPEADALILPSLTRAYAASKNKNDAVGLALIRSLAHARAALNLPADELARLLKNYPEETRSVAKPLLEGFGTDLAQQEARLDELSNLLEGGDFSSGKQIFFGKAACAACHRVSGQGGLTGPNLTSIAEIRSGRDLLESLLYPSASIVQEYRPFIVETDGGGLFTGLVTRETHDAVWLQGADLSEQRIESAHIRSRRESPVSLMPQGLDQTLEQEELRDLLAFLQGLKKASSYQTDR